jgi:hypothetical protein
MANRNRHTAPTTTTKPAKGKDKGVDKGIDRGTNLLDD